MRHYIPFLTSIVTITLLSWSASLLLKRRNKKMWQSSLVGKFSHYFPITSLVFVLFWTIGALLQIRYLYAAGATVSAIAMLISIGLLVSLPFSYVMDFIARVFNSFKKDASENYAFSDSRRRFLKVATSSIPLIALGTAGTGVARSYEKVRIPNVDMYFPDLPDNLHGFKIAHLSDLHLGYYFHLHDLEQALLALEAEKPDLFIVTGDISDDLDLLPDALKLIHGLNTPFNGFVSIGNHEYYRGFKKAARIFDAGPIEFLLNRGTSVNVNGHNLFVGGADDPVTMRNEIDDFLAQTVSKSIKEAPEDAFKILMSHRPRAFDQAAKSGVDLTLSGHTHGGQLGFNGKSLLDGLINDKYVWGKYKKGRAYLYTSAGMGHWFPFRLGCPPEAPIITLRKSNHVNT